MESLPPSDDLVLEVEARSLPHGLHYLEDADAFALAEIVRLVPCVRRAVEDLALGSESFQREQMSCGKVENMEVIPDTGSVTATLC